MKTESMPALVIHKLTQAQYDAALQAGKINENELYLTPEPDIDLATILEDYVLKTTSINGHALATDFNLIPSDINAAPATHSHITADIDNLDSVLSDYALTTMKINGYSLTEDFDLSWEDVGAAESEHDHDSAYHTKNEISEMFVTVNESISDIVNGSTVVHSAENDGNGDSITSTYETKTDANQKLEKAKDYADGIKDDLLNGAGTAYDTLKELGDLINDNTDAIEALELIAAGKQDKITGTAGQFVVIGSDGKVTTKTVYNFEEASF